MNTRHQYIKASAGTGKTFTITKKVLELIQNGTKITDLAVVTFTEKAAAELLERITERIKAELNEKENAYCKEALSSIESAPIGTIHSFCRNILREHAYVTGRSFLHEELEGDEDSFLEEEAFSELKNFLGIHKADELRSFLETEEMSLVKLKTAMVALNHKTESIPFRLNLNEVEEVTENRRKKKKDKNDDIQPILEFIEFCGNEYIRIYRSLLEKKDLITKNLILTETLGILNPGYFGDDRIGNHSSSDIFTKFEYIIIDEFQDTSPIQMEIFLALANRGSTDKNKLIMVGDPKQSIYMFRNADITRLEKMKNSLGGIEDDDLPTAFRTPPALTSVINTLFSHIQEKFPDGYTEVNSGREEFESPKKKPPLIIYGLTKEMQKIQWESNQNPNRESAKLLAKTILHITGNPEYAYYPKGSEPAKGDQPILIRYSDIAVLHYTKSTFEILQEELGNLGIPSSIYKAKNLFTSQIAGAISAILSVLENPQDEHALILAYKSPIFNLNDTEVYNLNSSRNLTYLNREHSEGLVKTAKDTLWEAYRNRQYKSITETIYFVLEKSGALCSLASGFSASRNFADLNYICESLELQRSQQGLGFGDLSRNLRTMVINGSEHDTKIDRSDGVKELGAVKMLTFHASKGLEFPVAALFGLDKNYNNSTYKNKNMCYFEENTEGIFTGNLELYISSKIKTRGYDDTHYNTYKEKLIKEKYRLLYVAITRAMRYLILPGHTPKNSTLLSLLNEIASEQSIQQFFQDGMAENSALFPEPNQKPKNSNKDKESYRIPEPFFPEKKVQYTEFLSFSSLHILSEKSIVLDEGEEENTDSVNPSVKENTATFIHVPKGSREKFGVAYHRIMELYPFGDLETDASTELILDLVKQEYKPDQEQRSISFLTQDRMIAIALRTIRGSINFGDMSIPINQIQRATKEKRFYSVNPDVPGRVITGIVDLAFFYDGKYYLLDWKTNGNGRGEEYFSDDALSEIINTNYQEQAKLYSLEFCKNLSLLGKNPDESFGGFIFAFVSAPEDSNDRIPGICIKHSYSELKQFAGEILWKQ